MTHPPDPRLRPDHPSVRRNHRTQPSWLAEWWFELTIGTVLGVCVIVLVGAGLAVMAR